MAGHLAQSQASIFEVRKGFICGTDRYTFDRQSESFENHQGSQFMALPFIYFIVGFFKKKLFQKWLRTQTKPLQDWHESLSVGWIN
jgi:hypothetical protein